MPDSSGLVSVLGAFADRIQGPELPVRGQLWFVARLELEERDFDQTHVFVVAVQHSDRTEQVARLEASAFTGHPIEGQFDPEMPLGSNLVVPLPLEFRRLGIYEVSLVADGEPIWSCPLRVDTSLPAI